MAFHLILAGCSLAFSVSFNPGYVPARDTIPYIMAEEPSAHTVAAIGASIIREENRRIPYADAKRLARAILEGSTGAVNYPLLLAMISTESRFNVGAVSPAGATGLGQLMPRTARYIAKKAGMAYSPDSIFDPAYNIRLSVKYLERLMGRHNGDIRLVAASYNGGPGGACRYRGWLEGRLDRKMVPAETLKYVERVMAKYEAYAARLRQE